MAKQIKKRSEHKPVLLKEVIEYLNPEKNQNFIDATVGGGGHTLEILKKISPQGKVMAFDWDSEAINTVKNKFSSYKSRLIFVNDNYSKLKTKIDEYKFNKVNGIICDLGYSSLQVETGERGFSFHSQGPLDLRYNQAAGLTADEILNKWTADQLLKIFQEYGEEPLAKKIVQAIILVRKKTKITGSGLKQIVERVYGQRWSAPSRTHPATRVWQALRIAVNQEFDNLKSFLPQAIDVLRPTGRLAVISFHSGEDRIVKNYFKNESKDCLCPPDAPRCVCGHKAILKIITKRVVRPTAIEIRNNPRSRSAKLRVVEKV